MVLTLKSSALCDVWVVHTMCDMWTSTNVNHCAAI